MARLSTLICLIFACAILSLSAQKLPLFPSRTVSVPLQSKDGQTITAVIQDVSLEHQNTRIFVEEQRNTFTVSLDTFDTNSLATLHDWYYKRLLNERLSIRSEETNESDTSSETPMNHRAKEYHLSGASDGMRKRKIIATIYNPSPEPVSNIHVVHGVHVSRSVSDSGLRKKPADKESSYNSHHSIPSIGGRAEIKIGTPPILLESSTTSYFGSVSVNIPGRGIFQEQKRFNRKEYDRISASYVLVYYKNELVAATATRNSLITERLQYRTKAFVVSAEGRQDPGRSGPQQMSVIRHESRHRATAASAAATNDNQTGAPKESEGWAENAEP